LSIKVSTVRLEDDQKSELLNLVDRVRTESGIGNRGAGYLVLSKDELPNVIPASLREKCLGAVAMVSDVNSGFTALAINLRRWDSEASAVDQEPFAAGIVGNSTQDVGWFVHHGDWGNRTNIVAESDAWIVARENNLSDFVILTDSPPSGAGPLSDLEDRSDRAASQRVWKHMYDALSESD